MSETKEATSATEGLFKTTGKKSKLRKASVHASSHWTSKKTEAAFLFALFNFTRHTHLEKMRVSLLKCLSSEKELLALMLNL